jgi:DNA-binding Lrp family transcriptional regulator
VVESVVLDDLDRALVHALQLDGRVPFGVVAEVLGVSDHTVARRYRRLRGAGLLRVVGLAQSAALGHTDWFVRLRCLPDSALPIAKALARRDDISWVMLTSAGTEITCLAQTRTRPERDALLLGALPRTRQVVEVDALCVLATFAGGASGWNGRAGALDEQQVAALTPDRPDRAADRVVVDDVDLALLALLRRDARIPVVELAAALRCSPSAASRRLDRLLERGALAFDVEIAPEHLGFGVEALLWLDVAPGALDETGRAVAGHAPVALAAATSGSSNLLLAVGCRDTADLYDYLARRLGPLPAVAAIHSAPVIRTVKRAGTVLDPPPA